MANPLVTVRNVQSELNITQPGALIFLWGIEQRGWLRQMGAIGRGVAWYGWPWKYFR